MLQQLSSVYFLVDQPNLVMIWENRPVGQKQTLFILFSDLWSINRYLLFAVFCRVKHCQCVFSLVYLVCKFVVWQFASLLFGSRRSNRQLLHVLSG